MNSAAVVISVNLRDVLLEEKAQQIASVREQISEIDRAIQAEVEGHLASMGELNERSSTLRQALMSLSERYEAIQVSAPLNFTPAPQPNPFILQQPPANNVLPMSTTMGSGQAAPPSLPMWNGPVLLTDEQVANLPKVNGKPLVSNEDVMKAAMEAKNREIESAQRQPHVKAPVEATFFDKGDVRPNGATSTRGDEALAAEMIAEAAEAKLAPTPAEAASKAEAAPSSTSLPVESPPAAE